MIPWQWLITGALLFLLAPSPTVAQSTTPTDSLPVQLNTSAKSPNAAFWRSLAFPGLGQHYVGQKTKAYLFAGLEIALIGAIIYEHERTTHYADLMEQTADTPDVYLQHSEAYLTHFDRRQNIIWANVAFWFYNAADAYVAAHLLDFKKPVEMTSDIHFDGQNKSPTYYVGLRYRWD